MNPSFLGQGGGCGQDVRLEYFSFGFSGMGIVN